MFDCEKGVLLAAHRRTGRLGAVLSVVLAALLVTLTAQFPQIAAAAGSNVPESKTWSFDPSDWDEETRAKLDPAGNGMQGAGATGELDGLRIDATRGKFDPRDIDTQLNQGAELSFDVPASEDGAQIRITLSGNTTQISSSSSCVTLISEDSLIIYVSPDGGEVELTFEEPFTYLSEIALVFNEPVEEFPGNPGDVAVLDHVWDFSTIDPSTLIQNETGEVDGLKVDATAQSAKFDSLRDAEGQARSDVQVNGGTVINVPVAQSDGGAKLIVSGNLNGQTLEVAGVATAAGTPFEVDTSGAPHYVRVEIVGDGSAYLTGISIDYDADTSTYPGTPEGVSAVDRTWDLTGGIDQTEENPENPDNIQGKREDWNDIRVDALTGKFDPRSEDTQVNGGTVLYVPVAADAKGSVLRVEGNNNGNLTLTVDGEAARFGADIALDASAARYAKLEFSGSADASAYLTSISIDYRSDSSEAYHVVTVGPSGDYQTINAALAAEDSSLKDHLVLSIAPGSYHERVVVSKPGVIFQNADETGKHAVVIRASYFSGNVWDENGNYIQQDPVYDLGTDRCATVLVEASGTGFAARGITFQNDYNVVDHVAEGEQTPAVAFNSKADKVQLQNCTFIGRQDTLYLQGTGNRVYLTDCYVEGTVDFIFGDADAYFEGCSLHMTGFAGRTSGYFTAANTKKGYVGLVFANCTLTADASLTEVSLGRPWQNLCYYSGQGTADDGRTFYKDIDTGRVNENGYDNVSSAVTFIGCTMPSNLQVERWNRWTGRNEKGETVSVTYDATVRFQEYASRNADGSLAEGNGKIVLGKLEGGDVDALSAKYLSNMAIGESGWMPADLAFQPDGGYWTPATPIGPATPVTPVTPVTPESPDTGTGNEGENNSEADDVTGGQTTGTVHGSGGSGTAAGAGSSRPVSTVPTSRRGSSVAVPATEEPSAQDNSDAEKGDDPAEAAAEPEEAIEDEGTPLASGAARTVESTSTSGTGALPIVVGVVCVGVAAAVAAGVLLRRRSLD